MEIDLVGESLKFMVLGMLIVFVFLLLLVEIMKLQAKIINKFFPEKVPEVVPAPSSNATQETHHVAAIIAAVTEFRKQS
ncbi:OadG family transporter subunit [Sulfurovum sp.]|uniref:OadG family protein n=1 Tax=Sulfurovum sp. TaxID=1969726 RepID=UPI002867EBB3|nr:OadG family transporter subunit [Sulfurovum sp.]